MPRGPAGLGWHHPLLQIMAGVMSLLWSHAYSRQHVKLLGFAAPILHGFSEAQGCNQKRRGASTCSPDGNPWLALTRPWNATPVLGAHLVWHCCPHLRSCRVDIGGQAGETGEA